MGFTLATVKGWLSDDDPFLAAVDEIVAARVKTANKMTIAKETKKR